VSTSPDFGVFDAHAFRVSYNVLLDIPLDPVPAARVWVATIWPDASQPGRWRRLLWQPHPSGRGWLIEPLTHLGDVIEFGADYHDEPDRWYGFVSRADETSILLAGPYESPAEALEDGRHSFERWRLNVTSTTGATDPEHGARR
jgi:hypothetical protein